MACKYKYKNNWYSEEEVKKLLFISEFSKDSTIKEFEKYKKSNVEVDLSGVKVKEQNFVGKGNLYTKEEDKFFITIPQFKRDKKAWDNFADKNNKVSVTNTEVMFFENNSPIGGYTKLFEITDWERLKNIYENTAQNNKFDLTYLKQETDLKNYRFNSVGGGNTSDNLSGFIEKNKEYEQSKEIIEQWKKENNIQYDPEEVYSRGQGFYSSIGAYSNLELDLLLKNLIQHIQDNKKGGGEFTISAFTKPIDKRLKHIEGTGDRVRFVIYPKSEHIKWAAPTDVYSGSVWDAHEKVSKDKKSELLGVSFTKAPSLRNINEVSPNLAGIIDNLSHAHNELGIELTTDNFRIEYDDNIDYSTKRLIDNINKILDDKYGKLVKPEIKTPKSNVKITPKLNALAGTNGSIHSQKQKNGDIILGISYWDKEGTSFRSFPEYGVFNTFNDAQKKLKEVEKEIYDKIINEQGKQPIQTRENTTSIESVRDKVFNVIKTQRNIEREDLLSQGYKELDYGVLYKEKEYTSQAETNLKVAALKEVARRYPRSLITSKVAPINPNMVDNSEIQYSKKQGYSPKTITDEYGNTWNEIIINSIDNITQEDIKKLPDCI